MNQITIFLFLIAMLLLAPVIGIVSINTLLDQSGSAHQVPHNMWTYLAIYGIAFVTRGGK